MGKGRLDGNDRPYVIRELTEDQVTTVVNGEKFSTFGPVQCDDCGYRGTFRRRLFEIAGPRDDEVSTDEFHGLMRLHMKRRNGLNNIFFRCDEGRHYIDTAFCEACGSNIVVYDLKPRPGARRHLLSSFAAQIRKRDSG